MIRVRYKDLSAGLHGQAEWGARGTTIYLVPGLTGGQRRAALRRLRQEASRGCGPALPATDLTVALAADRLRVGVRNTAAVIRTHPAGSLLPAALAGLLLTLFVLASISARVAPLPQAGGGAAPGGGNLAMAGAPVLVRESQAAVPAVAHGTARSQALPWSLAALSTPVVVNQSVRHSAILGRACGTSATGKARVVAGHSVRKSTPIRACRTTPTRRLSGKTGNADWGDATTNGTVSALADGTTGTTGGTGGNADWGDAPSMS